MLIAWHHIGQEGSEHILGGHDLDGCLVGAERGENAHQAFLQLVIFILVGQLELSHGFCQTLQVWLAACLCVRPGGGSGGGEEIAGSLLNYTVY